MTAPGDIVGEQGSTSGIAVLTSGGDASGMNAAIRAVARTAHAYGVTPWAVHEGFEGLVAGGERIRELASADVGGILQQGGSVIGSARSEAFRTREGRRRAAANLVARGIDALVVVGGDGSLTGADLFRREWQELLAELVDSGEVDAAGAARADRLRVVGLVGSIDNDMFGTDMTIGTDTALHRIVEAVDAIHSTAASHQRSFVVEVMGRDCGYLALMAALATGANWVLIPEHPPEPDTWRAQMCDALRAGERSGRRQHLVMLAEGARDRAGDPIRADDVRIALEEGLGEDTRITTLGHVQRGGRPSAYDRRLGTVLGDAAVRGLLAGDADEQAQVVGVRENRVVTSPLAEAVERTREVAARIADGDYDGAMVLRGGSFAASLEILRTLSRSRPHAAPACHRPRTIALLHAGGPAPGMNTAARVAVRLVMDAGHRVLGVRRGFEGLLADDVAELGWMSVTEWTWRGGAELGVSRLVPDEEAIARIAERFAAHGVDGLMMIGGSAGYSAVAALHAARLAHPELDVPMICLPASINNDLPASEVSVGSDTALNSVVGDVDKIKQSAVASRRCFVVEVMGRDCGYLALMGGLATGAEEVYLPEEGISIDRLRDDVARMTRRMAAGARLGLVLRSEHADPHYTTSFVHAVYEREGGDLFDVRESVLGHVQQGGDPSPFDRTLATRLAARCVDFLVDEVERAEPRSAAVGLRGSEVVFTDVAELGGMLEPGRQRPREQWWLELGDVAERMVGDLSGA